LVYLTAGEGKSIPTTSLIMIIAVYGLQAFVFLLRRKWDMIGWMVFYILAIPAFSFYLPLYSFWRMDDFSWGQTRLVMGESGKKMVIHDEGKFDPRAIPLKTWEEYENELWDKESNHSIGSWVPPQKFQNGGYAQSAGQSLYGRETYYEPSQYGHAPAPPGYQSGRNSPYGAMPSPMRAQSDAGSLYAPTRTATNYLDMPIPMTGSPDGLGGPSDSELENAVQELLAGADLNTVTKREVRRKLEERFNMDLTSRKGTINAAIDRALMSRAT
jgi:chitin synthase